LDAPDRPDDMTELVAVHALVELDPEGEHEIEGWREQHSRASDDKREDTRIRLHRYETGDEIIVRLATTIELAGDDGRERRPGPSVSGVWFARDDQAGNREHARQLIIQRVRRLVDELGERGVHQRTVGMPVVLHLDEAVEQALGDEQPTRLRRR
jgi:hypothetical protein